MISVVFRYIACVAVGYLLGSIPFGVIVSKYFARLDVRQYGSGATGTTNVLRTAGKKAAVLVFTGDLLKGVLAVVFAWLIMGNSYLAVGNFGLGLPLAQVLAALAAVAGHNWSIFLKFRGGRGVTTYFGGLIALLPIAAVFGGEVFLIGAVATRFVSLGSIAGVIGSYAIIVPLTVLNGWPLEILLYGLIGVVVILFMHRGNIKRLLAGNERRLGEKAEGLEHPAEREAGEQDKR